MPELWARCIFNSMPSGIGNLLRMSASTNSGTESSPSSPSATPKMRILLRLEHDSRSFSLCCRAFCCFRQVLRASVVSAAHLSTASTLDSASSTQSDRLRTSAPSISSLPLISCPRQEISCHGVLLSPFRSVLRLLIALIMSAGAMPTCSTLPLLSLASLQALFRRLFGF